MLCFFGLPFLSLPSRWSSCFPPPPTPLFHPSGYRPGNGSYLMAALLRILRYCPTIQILYKNVSIFHHCLLPMGPGLWVPSAYRTLMQFTVQECALPLALEIVSSPFLPPFLTHYYHSKSCLSFKSEFKWNQFFKAC